MMTNDYYNRIQKIDKILNGNIIGEELFPLINETSYENYFFKELIKLDEPKILSWFILLREKGYFENEKAPGYILAEEKGLYRIPEWNVLSYLEKISSLIVKMSKQDKNKYIKELLEIITNVTNYHRDIGQIDNYRTWWYFVKILGNIPAENIPMNVIELIPTWLESKFDNSLQGGEILKKLLPNLLKGKTQDDIIKAEKTIDFVTQIKAIPKYTPEKQKEIKEQYKHVFDKPEKERTNDDLLAIYFFNPDEIVYKTIIDSFWLLEGFIKQQLAVKVGEKFSDKVILLLAARINEIIKLRRGKNDYDLSHIWLESMYDSEKNSSDATEILTLILRDIILAKARTDKVTTITLFNKIVEEYKYPLFKRIILFVIGTEWDNYKDLFWEMLDSDSETMLFNDPHYEAEMYMLLQNNIEKIDDEHRDKIKRIIEEKVPKQSHSEKQYEEIYAAHQKQKWYSAMKNHEPFKSLYEQMIKITQEDEHIRFKEPKVMVGPGASPKKKEDILGMTNEDISKFLIEFKGSDPWKEPTIGGLSDIFKAAVEEKPDQFVENLEPFLKVGYLYIYDILWGLNDAWANKKIFNWGHILSFFRKYISSDDFWENKRKVKGDDWHANHLWVIGMMGSLITKGTENDLWAFSEDYFKLTQEVLFCVIDGLLKKKVDKIDEESIDRDLLTYSLNSTFGKITEALFMLAWRIKRMEVKNKKEYGTSWTINIKEKYEELLNNDIIDSYVWFGRYLPNFFYIEKEWAENKTRDINAEKGLLWKAFITGYLFSNGVYDNIYTLMKQHYLAAIEQGFNEKHIQERLAQHICIGYLRSNEDINNSQSLFRKIIDKNEFDYIKEIIGFLWMQRRDYDLLPTKSVVMKTKDGKIEPEIIKHKETKKQTPENAEMLKIENKIIEFWRWIYENKYKNKKEHNEDDKKILSDLCRLTVFLPNIDKENSKWLMLSAPYSHIGFNSSFFIEYLNNIKNKGESIKYIADVYNEILKGSTPNYKRENIRSIVEYISENDSNEKANNICSIYGSRGHDFLRDIWEKNKTV